MRGLTHLLVELDLAIKVALCQVLEVFPFLIVIEVEFRHSGARNGLAPANYLVLRLEHGRSVEKSREWTRENERTCTLLCASLYRISAALCVSTMG